MNIFIIITILITVTLLLGILVAVLFTRLSTVVAAVDAGGWSEAQTHFNPTLTLGHPISVDGDASEQLLEARRLAAQRAAAMPRGANMRFGGRGVENVRTARDGVENDPITAVKIAAIHGWQMLHVDDPWLQPEASPATQQAGAAVAAAKSPDELVPGKDYPFIEIDDSLSPDEIRKARIANAKAKSAAIKALKEVGDTAPAGNGAPAATPSPASAPPAAAPAGAEPVPGRDYEEIEITDGMPPEEVRKARIANAKAKAAAAKRLKEPGVTAAAPPAAAEPAAEAVAAPAPAAEPAVPAQIAPPTYIQITDAMPPDEVRQARIANAKAKSAYNKALKEAGIDPATVEGS
jgi:hypothetical protein